MSFKSLRFNAFDCLGEELWVESVDDVEEELATESNLRLRFFRIEVRDVAHDKVVILDLLVDLPNAQCFELRHVDLIDFEELEVILLAPQEISEVHERASPLVGHVNLT